MSIIKYFRDIITGDMDCPAYWWEKGFEDYDEGCDINNDLDCWKCKYRFLPNIIIRLVVKYKLWKEEKYYEQLGKDL